MNGHDWISAMDPNEDHALVIQHVRDFVERVAKCQWQFWVRFTRSEGPLVNLKKEKIELKPKQNVIITMKKVLGEDGLYPQWLCRISKSVKPGSSNPFWMMGCWVGKYLYIWRRCSLWGCLRWILKDRKDECTGVNLQVDCLTEKDLKI